MAEQELRADLEATLAARRDLGEDYDAALAKSFLEKLDREVEARVHEAVSLRDKRRSKSVNRARRHGTGLAITSIALGIPVTAVISSNLHGGTDSLIGVIVAWGAIAGINFANAIERWHSK